MEGMQIRVILDTNFKSETFLDICLKHPKILEHLNGTYFLESLCFYAIFHPSIYKHTFFCLSSVWP
jgi:hypothetical protein